MKKIAVFGTHGLAQAFARKARLLGVESHCFAQPLDEATRAAFDACHEVSLADADALVRECEAVGIDGVLHTSEFTFRPAALVAEALGLDGNPSSVTREGGGITDKFRNRECCRSVRGLGKVEYERVRDLREVGERWRGRYPFIIKPTAEAGKRGVSIVRDEADLAAALRYTAGEPSRNSEYIVESLIPDGTNLSVEGLSFRGTHTILQVTNAVIDTAHHCAELGHQQPALLAPGMREKVEELDRQVLDAVGVVTGPTHTEMRVVGDEVYLIEVNARGGGDLISERLVELSTGYDYVSGMILAALGDLAPIDASSLAHYHAGIWYVAEQTAYLQPVLEESARAPWCVMRHVAPGPLTLLTHNGQDHSYFVYRFEGDCPEWVFEQQLRG